MVKKKRRFKKSVFVYPYRKPDKFEFYNFAPPVGLEHVATAVKNLTDEIHILDMRYEKEPLENFLGDADFAGFGLNWPHQLEHAAKLLEMVAPSALVVWGGIYATENALELMKQHDRLDCIVMGEGENAAVDLFSGVPPEKINGIVYRKGKKILSNKIIGKYDKTMELYPDRSLRRYAYEGVGPLGISTGYDLIMTSRGCNFTCEFCTHRFDGEGNIRRWSHRSAENVVEEIRQIKADLIGISDDDFTVDKKRVEKICDLLIEQKIRKRYLVESRIEIGFHPELVRKMWKAGFRFVAYGLESSQDKTLKRIGKGFTRKKAIEAFRTINTVPMLSYGFFIVGYIHETKEEMLDIADFARTLNLDFINTAKLKALKNSPIRDIVEKLPGYYIDHDTRVFSDQVSKDDVYAVARQIRRRFYTPKHIFHIVLKMFRSGIMFDPVLWRILWNVFWGLVMGKKFNKKFVALR